MRSIAIGVGCRQNIPANMIAALVRRGLDLAGLSGAGAQMFSIEDKREDIGLNDAARMLAMPLTFLPKSHLARYNGAGVTASKLVQAQFGLDSVCETAALAGAGEHGALVLARICENGATCAIAVGAAS